MGIWSAIERGLIRAVVSDANFDIALRTAIGVAFSALLRVREYTCDTTRTFNPVSTLLRKHVRFDSKLDCFAIRIVHSKSDPYNTGGEVLVSRSPHPGDPLRPVAML